MAETKNITLADDEKLMLELKTFQMVGVDDYNALLNLPKINGVEVSGEKTLDDYDMANKTALNAHIANKGNPHNVTKAQVGLGNVDNTADADKYVKRAEQAENSTTVNGHTVNSDVPADAKFTDTTYSLATSSVAGLMSAADKAKIDGTTAITNSEIDTIVG